MTYYISDLHFGHGNILAFDDRPFTDIETHDKALVEKWNEKVSPDDTVWILGDVSWYGVMKTNEILDSLNGIKNLCVGNHDSRLIKNRDFRDRFSEIVNYKEIESDDGKGIVLCHYPIPCFKNHYDGWIHLYGHVHGGWEWNIMEHVRKEMDALYKMPCRMYNVGCMLGYMNYAPKTMTEILAMYERGGSR